MQNSYVHSDCYRFSQVSPQITNDTNGPFCVDSLYCFAERIQRHFLSKEPQITLLTSKCEIAKFSRPMQDVSLDILGIQVASWRCIQICQDKHLDAHIFS